MNTTTRRPPARVRLLAASAVLLAGALSLTACSTDDGPDGTDRALGSTASADWSSCMRTAGFEVEDPSAADFTAGRLPIPSGADEDAFSSASDTCLGGGSDAGSVSDSEQDAYAQQTRDFAQCMRDNGVDDFADPEDGTLDFQQFTAEEQSAPTFEHAQQTCAAKHLDGWSGL